nr:hypothetical protein [Pandoravirus massiliensis]
MSGLSPFFFLRANRRQSAGRRVCGQTNAQRQDGENAGHTRNKKRARENAGASSTGGWSNAAFCVCAGWRLSLSLGRRWVRVRWRGEKNAHALSDCVANQCDWPNCKRIKRPHTKRERECAAAVDALSARCSKLFFFVHAAMDRAQLAAKWPPGLNQKKRNREKRPTARPNPAHHTGESVLLGGEARLPAIDTQDTGHRKGRECIRPFYGHFFLPRSRREQNGKTGNRFNSASFLPLHTKNSQKKYCNRQMAQHSAPFLYSYDFSARDCLCGRVRALFLLWWSIAPKAKEH